ncbi:anthranilate synthase component I family protein [Aureibacter tunicatorum]|uniref:Anthranilate synthase component 1 n=1 Tax=Aureibacter tunicatorum TaxID=866807 RepID=A0AAE3XM94_9BACT|nr:anthranilate synthase component I family protein [Aureibacter tunicatorum]MDR6239193.1 anthranilate synthase component 1 [Aureibacter tunicatorum]BDD04881.1 anthranilate synthase component I [Aureibacter tunicatorum]
MKKFKLNTEHIKMIADTITPVSIYLRLRDRFANSIMLESSDYRGHENSFSYICCNPIASFSLRGNTLEKSYPDGSKEVVELAHKSEAVKQLSDFSSSFENERFSHKFINNGLFGYMAYDAVESFEDLDFSDNQESGYDIPEIHYNVYRNVIAIDHFKNELYLFEHTLDESDSESNLLDIQQLIRNKNYPSYTFELDGEVSSNLTDEEYVEMVKKGMDHCFKGDVFQIVLSRRFSQNFKGDEFNVYRALRSINPSPYLFYFDYGNFKIFGSSPEAQIVIKDRKASIYPIAGTFRRTGNDEADAELAKKLDADPKENSEHVMLVDLARNDLSRNGKKVTVETYKEVQFFSHVIHLVSKVTGELEEGHNTVEMVANTFPAGTLSGAPKYKAMQLINEYENIRRGFYGGAIGYLGFNGDFNHAIMIRSFLSKNNKLSYQAGAGVVAKSDPESEKQEVYNKVAALNTALKEAENI